MPTNITIETTENLNIDQFVLCILDDFSIQLIEEKDSFSPKKGIENVEFISVTKIVKVPQREIEYKPPHINEQRLKIAA